MAWFHWGKKKEKTEETAQVTAEEAVQENPSAEDNGSVSDPLPVADTTTSVSEEAETVPETVLEEAAEENAETAEEEE